MVPETGMVMNNEMNDFSIPDSDNAWGYAPSPANFVKPGKRPLSSISPIIVESIETGEVYFLTGASGGSHIITATTQSLWRVLDQKLSAPDALAAPRFHDQLIPNEVGQCHLDTSTLKLTLEKVSFEYEYSNATVQYMEEKKCHVSWSSRLSSVNAILRKTNGEFEPAAEPTYQGSGAYSY